jgi:MurNAc alpha-1-phosphate uridylyltransferase
MLAMILAAGLGKRLRPLTEQLPKALVPVAGKSLIEYHIAKLGAVGIGELVINTSWLGELIERRLGDGGAFGVCIQWSREREPLETGGGIRRALPLLGPDPFVALSADIWSDYCYSRLPSALPTGRLAHLVLVPNPPHNPDGDYGLDTGGMVRPRDSAGASFTFSGLAVLAPELVADFPDGAVFPLRDALRRAIAAGAVSGEVHAGLWSDVGTPERLAALEQQLASGDAAMAQCRGERRI